ncbi:MAG: ATP-binding cassette domain-containing protein [Desulfobacula sp.]|nr:ATP-binding cassette domain-containing protein [Desulfobacula sp.]
MKVPFIQFIDVTKSFGSQHVLKGLNLSIYKGEITAIIGKSGTGKSVLLKHIIGLEQQDSGQILINGEPLHQLPTEDIKSFQKELSYMFQDNALFDFMTIYDNIALPLVENSNFSKIQVKEKVLTRMKQMGLIGEEDKFPAQLSGGMRKRVALARAVVTDPKIVLFDEPTTGLDPVRKKNVHSMIKEYQEKFGFTAVIVSHDIPHIFNVAQRIAMLDDGVIKFEGSKRDILDSHSKILNAFIRGEDV